jgi:hypothetical protein
MPQGMAVDLLGDAERMTIQGRGTLALFRSFLAYSMGMA